MLKAIKQALSGALSEAPAAGGERRQLQLAVAVLLHEARRSDYVERDVESATARRALADLFELDERETATLLQEGRARAQQLTSFYAPVTVIKRQWPLEERVRLVEHLWRVAFADGHLNPYEDHYVRKIAHLLYLSNTQSMLARNRARG